MVTVTSATAQITWDGGAGDGLWSSALNWSTNTVPGDEDDVQIIGNFSVTVNASDSCRSLVIQAGNSNPGSVLLRITNNARLGVRFNVQMDDRAQSNNSATVTIDNGGFLNVGADFIMLKDNSANNNNHMIVTLNDDNSQLIAGGDFEMTVTSGNDDNNDIGLSLEEDSRVQCTNMIVTMGGNLNDAYELFRVNQTGVVGDAAIIDVANDFTVTNNAGAKDFIIDMDFAGEILVGGNFSYAATSGESFQLKMDGDAVFDVANDMTIAHGGNEQIDIFLNQISAGVTTDAQLLIGGALSVTQSPGNNADELRIFLNEDADFVVGSDFILTKNEGENSIDHLEIRLRGNSKLDVNAGFDLTMDDNQNFNLLLDIEDNAELEVTNDFNIQIVNCNIIEVNVSDFGVLDVGGNLGIDNDQNSNLIELDFDDNATVTVGGGMSVAQDNGTRLSLYMDGDAALSVAGDLQLIKSNNENLQVYLNQSVDGSANDARIVVGGEWYMNRSIGDRIEVLLSQGSGITVANGLRVDVFDTNNNDDYVRFSLGNTSFVDITGDIVVNIDEEPTGNDVEFEYILSGSSSFSCSGNFSLTTEGGDSNFTLINDATLTIDGNWIVRADNANGFIITANNTSNVAIGGYFDFLKTTNGNGEFRIDMDNTASLTVGEYFLVNSAANDNMRIELDGDASFLITDFLNLTKDNNLAVLIHLNQNAAGSGSDALLSVGTTFDLTRGGVSGDEVEVYLADGSEVITGGNWTVNVANSENNADYVRFRLTEDADINVNGDLTISLDEVPSGNDSDFELIASGNAGFVVTGNLSLTSEGGESSFSLSNNASLSVNGDWLNVHHNANSFTIASGNAAVIDLDGFFSFMKNTTGGGAFLVNMDGTSSFTVGEYFLVNSAAGADVQFELDGDASLVITDYLDVTKDNNGKIAVHMNQVTPGTADDALFSVGTTTTMTRGGTSGDEIEVYLADGSLLSAGGDWSIMTTNTENNVDYVRFQLDDESGITIAGALDVVLDEEPAGNEIEFEVYVRDNSSISMTSDLSLVNEGGNTLFLLSENGLLDIDGNWTNEGNEGDAFSILMTGTSEILLGGDFSYEKPQVTTGGFTIDMEGVSLFEVGGNALIDDNSGNAFQIHLDNDAVLDIAGNVELNKANGQNFELYLNNAADGTTTDAQFLIGGNFTANTTDGADMNFSFAHDANWDVVGDIFINFNTHDNINSDNLMIQLTGNAQVNAAGSLEVNANYPTGNTNHTVSLSGNAQMNAGPPGGPYSSERMHFQLNGNNAQFNISVDDNAILRSYGDLSLSKIIGGNFNLTANGSSGTSATVHVWNDLVFNNDENAAQPVVVQMNQSSLLDVDGDVDYRELDAATRGRIELNNSAKMELAGNFLRDPIPFNFGALLTSVGTTIEFNGFSNSQIIPGDDSGGSDVFTYHNIIINNSFGTSPQVTVEALATIRQGITFVDGIVETTSTQILVLVNDGTATGASDDSHVDGYFRKVGNTGSFDSGVSGNSFAFPVGDGGYYLPVYISPPTNATDSYEARYVRANPNVAYGDIAGAGIDHVSGCEYWQLRRVTGASNVTASLGWKDSDMDCSGVLVPAELRVARWNGSAWQNDGNAAFSPTPSLGSVQAGVPISSWTSPVPLTLASTSLNNPLPIELAWFNAIVIEQTVKLAWKTITQLNNERFIVERSVDGREWEELETIPGAGTTNEELLYETWDLKPHAGRSYYRLVQVDTDGSSSWSDVQTVYIDDLLPADVLFPNPVRSGNAVQIPLHTAEAFAVSVVDVMGRVVLEHSNFEANENPIVFRADLPAATYLVKVLLRNRQMIFRMIVVE